jgi:Skp family chaperone for outer membrane proteins
MLGSHHVASVATRAATSRRAALPAALALALVLAFTPQVLATGIADIGFVDQASIGQLGPFAAAQAQFAQYQHDLGAQFQAQIKGKNPADQQRIYADFNARAAAKQREIFGPLLDRANNAIASVAANKGLSVVVDKSIIIYGGMDITKDVVDMLNQPGPVLAPINTPAPSAVGYVDQRQLDQLPKVKKANDDFMQFRQNLQAQLNAQLRGKSADQRQQTITSFNSQLTDEQKKVVQPVIDSTNAAIASVAKQKGLMLVIDSQSRVYGGTDVTPDVLKALQ